MPNFIADTTFRGLIHYITHTPLIEKHPNSHRSLIPVTHSIVFLSKDNGHTSMSGFVQYSVFSVQRSVFSGLWSLVLRTVGFIETGFVSGIGVYWNWKGDNNDN